MTMEAIVELLTYLFYSVFASFTVFYSLKYIKTRKNSVIKNDIQNIQASISLLRISLKAKIKKKANSFRSRFVKPINEGDPIDVCINELTENGFEKGSDFQLYFDLSKRINSFISTDIAISRDMSQEQFEDFMGPDYKIEISIIRVIKEMTELAVILNNRIDAYNQLNVHDRIANADSLIFPSIVEVNRVFKKEFEKENILKKPNDPSLIDEDKEEDKAEKKAS